MKRTYKYALSAVLSACLVVPAVAQTGFPDVKDTHWAADSVNRLKLSGLVHGFKDGEYKGDRTMTRYEMASAVYAIYAKLVCFNEEIDKKIKALEAKINSIKPNEPAQSPDLSDIKTALADMRNEFGSMKAWGNDLVQLKRMSSAYSTELKSLGVDIKEMQKNISDVSARVAKLESAPKGLMITGDANFWVGGASTANGAFGVVNQDGMFIGSNPAGAGFDTLTVLHELGVTIEDKKATIPYKAEIVIGNTLNDSEGFGNQVYDRNNLPQQIFSAKDSVYIHELTGMYRPWDIKVGRQGVMLNKFILRRPDTTSFYMNKRWDDHTFRMDGAVMGFAGGAGSVFMGQVSNAQNTDNNPIQPIRLNTLQVQRMMGGTYDIKFGGDKGKISASYVDFDGAGTGFAFSQPFGAGRPLGNVQTVISRYNVYGADLTYNTGGLNFELGGGKSIGLGFQTFGGGNTSTNGKTGSDTQNLDTIIDRANGRWDVGVGSHNDDHSFHLGYRSVEANYAAPGDWGRISIFRNLTDTKAYNAMASIKVNKKIGLHGWYEKGDAIRGIGNYASWRAGIGTELTSKWDADLTFEDTDFKGGFKGIVNGSHSRFNTLKLGYDVGAMRSFNVFWQQSTLLGVGYGQFPRTEQKGDFYGFQYSIKF